ncbi:MAG: SWIM zinc finger family protein [Myxococcota bacterium]|jgi:predicted nucleic acid-binding Zn finger protein|nr:SWIM zinc finger family protein [Myxococcota bacterium]
MIDDQSKPTVDADAALASVERLDFSLEYRGASQLLTSEGKSLLALYSNTLRESVKLRARVLDPMRFRELLSVLFEIVESDFRYVPKDRSAYLAYQQLKKQALSMSAWQAQKAFFEWLQRADPNAFTALDPVLSVHPDQLAFEVFSKDESTYAKLGIDWSAFEIEGELEYGTSNVDFSRTLFDGLQRMRSYRPSVLSIGNEPAPSAEGSIISKKATPPASWMRAFLQVQSAATLPRTVLSLAPIDLYNALRQLRMNADRKRGGRAIRIELVPGERPRLVLEPWECVLRTHGEPFRGRVAQVVRVWGRRRLMLLRRLLPFAERIELHLLGSGLPNFWLIQAGPYHLSLALSGFTASDWAKAMSFDLLLPRSPILAEATTELLGVLREKGRASFDELLAAIPKLDKSSVNEALQQACQQGKLVYDLQCDAYRYRPLSAEPLDLVKLEFRNERERVAYDLLAQPDAVKVSSESVIFEQGLELVGKVVVASEKREYRPVLLLSDEGMVRKAECTCSFFRKNGLKQGPCPHIIALRVAQAREEAKRREGRAGGRGRVTIESRTYVKRFDDREELVQLNLDRKRLKIRWGRRGEAMRLQNLVFNENGGARDAYFAHVDRLEAEGYLDASAT